MPIGHQQAQWWLQWYTSFPLQWRHNERDGVSNHRRLGCLFNLLLRRRTKKSTLRVTGLCEGNPPVTGGFPSQRASNTENVSIWWRHHVCNIFLTIGDFESLFDQMANEISKSCCISGSGAEEIPHRVHTVYTLLSTYKVGAGSIQCGAVKTRSIFYRILIKCIP